MTTLIQRWESSQLYDGGDFLNWVLESGIQVPQGFFYDWHDLDEARFGRPYPEITGYGISTLCWLFRCTEDEQLIERAEAAFRWTDTVALDRRWSMVRARETDGNGTGPKDQYRYSFDTGIVASGLVRLSQRLDDQRIGKAVLRIRNAFSQNLIRPDRTIWPLVDVQTDTPTLKDEKWSFRFSGYQLKTLMFLVLLNSIGQALDQKKETTGIFEAVLDTQQNCGAFPVYRNGKTHLHPHFYTLEGLVVAADVYGRPDWLEQALKGFLYAERFFAANGCLPTEAHKERVTVPHERKDTLAQFLRLGSYLVSVGCLDMERIPSTLSQARDRLLESRISVGAQRGGFLFGQDLDGTHKYHVNSWVSFFAGQALHWFELAREGRSIDVKELV